jgi:hypothetical protein
VAEAIIAVGELAEAAFVEWLHDFHVAIIAVGELAETAMLEAALEANALAIEPQTPEGPPAWQIEWGVAEAEAASWEEIWGVVVEAEAAVVEGDLAEQPPPPAALEDGLCAEPPPSERQGRKRKHPTHLI